jgi:hypothetical protein
MLSRQKRASCFTAAPHLSFKIRQKEPRESLECKDHLNCFCSHMCGLKLLISLSRVD